MDVLSKHGPAKQPVAADGAATGAFSGGYGRNIARLFRVGLIWQVRYMARHEKTLLEIRRGGSDANIGFDELRGLLLHLGFEGRVRGSHHIFFKD